MRQQSWRMLQGEETPRRCVFSLMDPFSNRAPILKQGMCHFLRPRKDAIFGHRRRSGKRGLSCFLHTSRGTAVLWRGHPVPTLCSEGRGAPGRGGGEEPRACCDGLCVRARALLLGVRIFEGHEGRLEQG